GQCGDPHHDQQEIIAFPDGGAGCCILQCPAPLFLSAAEKMIRSDIPVLNGEEFNRKMKENG
ncbi:MAG: hypothetical protein IIV27_04330, partial [Clostridia bacterium]|nr:hypothetical protein [Clostridia bacterium]